MSKAVGIDLGTTNSVVAFLEAGEPTVIPERRRRADDAVNRGVCQVRRGACRRSRKAPGDHEPGPDRPFGQAPDGDELVDRHRRQALQGPGDLREDPAEAEARRRGIPGRHRQPGRHHRPRLLRRRPAHRHERGRPDRRARGAAHHQRADRGGTRLRPRQGDAPTRPCSCSTSAAAPSTCRSSRSARASSR